MKSYYDIFNVPQDADLKEITQAYETLLNRYRARLDEEEFKRKAAILEKAYRVLADEDKRAKYDRMIASIELPLDEKPEEKAQIPEEPAAKMEVKTAQMPEGPKAPARPEKVVPKAARASQRSYLAVEEQEDEQVKDKPKITGLVIAIVVVFLLIAGGAYYFYNYMYVPESNYNKAVTLRDQGEFDKAIAVFSELKDYKDSPKQIINVQRMKGYKFINEKQYDKAMEIFTAINNQEDILKCRTAQAENLLAEKKYDEASAIFSEIGDEEGVSKSKYAQATALLQEGKKQEAFKAFKELGDYKDSAGKVVEIKASIQTQVYADLQKIDQPHIAFYSFDQAKQSVIRLNEIDNLAKTYELDAIYAEIESKWQMVESSYHGAYYRNVAKGKEIRNKKYFDTVGLTKTNDADEAEDEAAVQFSKNPSYLSLYAECLKGVSEKTLSVAWYKYKLDRATGEYTEREKVTESAPKKLQKIKRSLMTLIGFKKNAFTYGVGLYAAEVTVGDETEPAAVVYFYLQ